MDTKREESWFAGPTATIQEPSFIPRENGSEGEGWIIALLNHLDILRNDIVVLDAQDFSKGPVATIHLPLKLKLGLHGNFVDQKDIDECECPSCLLWTMSTPSPVVKSWANVRSCLPARPKGGSRSGQSS